MLQCVKLSSLTLCPARRCRRRADSQRAWRVLCDARLPPALDPSLHEGAPSSLSSEQQQEDRGGELTLSSPSCLQYVDPWYARGLKSVNNLTGIARTRVNERLQKGAGDRKDILSHLQNGKDSAGQPMGVPELTMEGASRSHCSGHDRTHLTAPFSPAALTQLIAGSDTTSNSSWCVRSLSAFPKSSSPLTRPLAVAAPSCTTSSRTRTPTRSCARSSTRRLRLEGSPASWSTTTSSRSPTSRRASTRRCACTRRRAWASLASCSRRCVDSSRSSARTCCARSR